MTSANVIEYSICDSTGKEVGRHKYNLYCKPTWGELLKFIPANNYTIYPYGYDEEESYWEGKTVNLQKFIDELKAKGAKFDTWEDIKKRIKW